jgi:hypothetical protein
MSSAHGLRKRWIVVVGALAFAGGAAFLGLRKREASPLLRLSAKDLHMVESPISIPGLEPGYPKNPSFSPMLSADDDSIFGSLRTPLNIDPRLADAIEALRENKRVHIKSTNLEYGPTVEFWADGRGNSRLVKEEGNDPATVGRSELVQIGEMLYVTDSGTPSTPLPKERFALKQPHFDVAVRGDVSFLNAILQGNPTFVEETSEGVAFETASGRVVVLNSDDRFVSASAPGKRVSFLDTANISVRIPNWTSNELTPRAIKVPDWEAILEKKPDLEKSLVPFLDIEKSTEPPDSVVRSQCGFPLYNPPGIAADFASEDDTLWCQINLAEVPDSLRVPDLPTTGLLQFRNDLFSGQVRYVELDSSVTSLPTDVVTIRSVDSIAPMVKGRIRLVKAFGFVDPDPFFRVTPREFRYVSSEVRRQSDEALRKILATRLGAPVRYKFDTMGGKLEGNGETPKGFTRLFSISDDVGYAYWHVPTESLKTLDFSKVEAGWTD